MKNNFKLFTILIFLLISTRMFAQNVIINYEAWNPSSPPCNIFGSGVNVPDTSNGSASTIEHQSLIGQPGYNTLNKSV